MTAPAEPLPPDAVDVSAAAPLRSGGWTGFWLVTWAACVGVPATIAGSGLLTVRPLLELARLRAEEIALHEDVPAAELLDPLDVVSDVAVGLAAGTWPWLIGAGALSVALGAAGVFVARGAERGRRLSRWLLAAMVFAALAAAAYGATVVVPRFVERADDLRAALHAISVATGQRIDHGLLEALAEQPWLRLAIGVAAATVVLPSVGLWLATGRVALREWCGLGAPDREGAGSGAGPGAAAAAT